jgi:hypothetical protein
MMPLYAPFVNLGVREGSTLPATSDPLPVLSKRWCLLDTLLRGLAKDITVTMTLKNRSNATIGSVVLSRSVDYDVGTGGADAGLRTGDTVML